VVDVEEARVGALEEERSPLAHEAVEEVDGVGDVRREGAAHRGEPRRERLRIGRRRLHAERLHLRGAKTAGDLEARPQAVGMQEVADPHRRRAADLVGVRRSDAAAGGADRGARLAEPAPRREELLVRRVLLLVVGQDQMRPVRDDEVAADLDPAAAEVRDLLEELLRIDHHPVADHAGLVGVEDARGDEMERVALAAHGDGVPGVRPAVVAHDHVVTGGEQVDDLALALVAPLEPHDRGVAGAGIGGKGGVHEEVARTCGDPRRPRAKAGILRSRPRAVVERRRRSPRSLRPNERLRRRRPPDLSSAP